MKKLSWLYIGLAMIFLIFASWFVVNREIMFHTDMARDFLLLDEIIKKKISLIGPRADWKGLFHGPLWLYFNLPAYIIGKGNPIIVGWYWIFTLVISALLDYLIIKKLFNKTTALLFIPLYFSVMMNFTASFYNPIGALFLIPLFYYFLIMYQKKESLKYLIFGIITAGLIFQFQLAVGGPIIILAIIFYFYKIIKSKKWHHIFGIFFILLPLSTFIIFDLRHNFSQLNAIINHFNGTEKYYSVSIIDRLRNRLLIMTGDGIGLTKHNFSILNVIISYLITIVVYNILTKNKKKIEYLIFLFIYLGFYILSTVHQSSILVHYYLPLIPLVIIIFSSLNQYMNKKIFYIFYFLIIISNFLVGLKIVEYVGVYKNKDKASWSGLLNVAKSTYDNINDKEFGLYLFAPDMYGYSEKYAFLYGQTLYPNKKMNFSQKKKETFLIYEPVPLNRPDLTGLGWKTGIVKINTKPIKTIKFDNGYIMEKYFLGEDEIKIQSDSILNDWVTQR